MLPVHKTDALYCQVSTYSNHKLYKLFDVGHGDISS